MVICSDFESTTLPIIAHTHVSIAAGFEKRSAVSLLFCIEYFSYLVLITHIYLVNITCDSFHVKKIVFIEIFAHIVMAHLDKMIFVVRPKVTVVSKCQRVQRVLPASLFSSFMANLL